jgi:hypothetical protein
MQKGSKFPVIDPTESAYTDAAQRKGAAAEKGRGGKW